MRYTLVLALCGAAFAAPATETNQATTPQHDSNPKSRAAGVAARNAGFIYGPSLIGEAAPFPNGTLGNARSKADYDEWSIDRKEIDKRIAADLQSLQAAVQAVSDKSPIYLS